MNPRCRNLTRLVGITLLIISASIAEKYNSNHSRSPRDDESDQSPSSLHHQALHSLHHHNTRRGEDKILQHAPNLGPEGNYELGELDDPNDLNQGSDDYGQVTDVTQIQRKLQGTRCSPAVIDFETAGDGTDLSVGAYVSKEWKDEYGLTITARGKDGGYTPDDKPRLFNSENPGDYRQLGSPNSRCNPRGPGSGSGGFPGGPGENCDTLGLVLIIQDGDTPYANDYPGGGSIFFNFDRPTDVQSLGLLDINTSAAKIYVTTANRNRSLIRVPRLGNNSAQTVDINVAGVVKVEVYLKNYGAITHLTFCPVPTSPPAPKPTPAPTNVGECVPARIAVTEDFEDGSLDGWTNGKIDYDPGFSTFLGRFVKNDPDPMKEYDVNRWAIVVVLEFNFYEIDSWNSDNRYGPDSISAYIGDDKLDIGVFSARRDEGVRRGVTTNGIDWSSRSEGPPRHIGFRNDRSYYVDQIHKITAIIPAAMYQTTGKLKLRLHTQVTATKATDESAGFDNIVITEMFDCQPQAAPATTEDSTLTVEEVCLPEFVVADEDFEDGSLAGWTNGKIDSDDGFSKFLGRFVKGNPDPFKTYKIPRDAESVVLEFDFYEIDSWNSDSTNGPDRIFVMIDDDKLDIGVFNVKRDEGVRRGSSENGIRWVSQSQGPPRYIGFRSDKTAFMDQVHRITARVPSSFYSTDGKLMVKFQTRVTATSVYDESSGFDNIKVTAKFDCSSQTPRPTLPLTKAPTLQPTPTPTVAPTPKPTSRPTDRPTVQPTAAECVRHVEVVNEDFENGSLQGWTNGKLETEDGFSTFLGRYGKVNTGPGKDPQKTYEGIPTSAESIILEFDFYEIDGWEAQQRDCLYFLVGRQEVFLGFFDLERNEDGRTGMAPGGIEFGIKSARTTPIGFNPSFDDQIHHITVEIPKRFYELDGKLQITFWARVTEDDINHESGGFDNIKITAILGCKPPRATPSPTRFGQTPLPTVRATARPTPEPTPIPSPEPTPNPTPNPTPLPSPSPTMMPTPSPTRKPTPSPTRLPTPSPTRKPTPSTPMPTPGPTHSTCEPSVVVHTETFEDGSLAGWNNGSVDYSPGFTKFLGRYGKSNSGPGSDPFKVYRGFPKKAAKVELEFDFYEIDSWDASHGDHFCVVVDHKRLYFGRFDLDVNENGRTGRSHGMTFRIESRNGPRHIGFNSRWKDQIHHVRVTIPKGYYKNDGRLKLMFQVRLNEQDLNNESAGFDNIKFTALFNCDEMCSTQRVIHDTETFENGRATGWQNGRIEYAPVFTKFLGRYGHHNSGPGKDPFKYYSNFPTDAPLVVLDYDFYEIDSWDISHADCAYIVINDRRVALGTFGTYSNEDGRFGSQHGVSFRIQSRATPRNIGFNPRWKDQIHHVTVNIPRTFYQADGRLKLMFQVRLNESDIDNESGGYDNIRFTARYDCQKRRLEKAGAGGNYRDTIGLEEGRMQLIENDQPVVHDTSDWAEERTTVRHNNHAITAGESEDLRDADDFPSVDESTAEEKEHEPDCQRASRIRDVVEIPTEQCDFHDDESAEVNPITIISQDGDTVTFTVSQLWKGCDRDERSGGLTWLATDFIGESGDLECPKTQDVPCGEINTFTSKCEDGAAVVELFVYDKTGSVIKPRQNKLFVPLACNTGGDATKMCGFRYLLQCSPSLCEPDSLTRIPQR